MLELDGFPAGSDITILNVYYQQYDYQNKKDDYATIIFKDNTTGRKHVRVLYSPTYTYYIAKPEIQIDHNMQFIDKNLVDPVTCKFRDILYSIAENTGNLDLFKDNIRTGNSKLNRMFYMHPRVFGADMDILNYIRMEFASTYTNTPCNISIAFFDIETDIINALDLNNIELGSCPVNAISLYHKDTNTVYSFILRNPKNPQIAELEKNMNKDFNHYRQEVLDFITQNINHDTNDDKMKKYGLSNINLSVGFFDSEEEEIVTFFHVLKNLNPDFAVAYNIAFDLPYLIKRLEYLNLEPVKVIGNQEFPVHFCYYYIDEQHKNEPQEKKDFYAISSYITYLDQMVIYASRRKGQAALQSNSLDSVGGRECNVRKLDYHDITGQFAKFPYLAFETFWLYNINDTIVQACIEAQTEDIVYMFNNAIEMNTAYQKIFRQTVYLYNKCYEFYRDHEGVIIGNNINKFGQKPTDKFPGAFVARPEKMTDKNKIKANGIYIWKYANANDFDYKRLYPSLIQEFNMAPNTQIGKIFIDDAPYKDPDELRLDAGSSFCENLTSYNFIKFCHRWLNLQDIEGLMKDINEYFTNYRTPLYKLGNGEGGLPYDRESRVVAYVLDKNAPIGVEREIPDWLMNEVNRIRRDMVE